MIPIQLLPLLRRYWPIAVIAFALVASTAIYAGKLRAERALERCRAEAAVAALLIARANQAAEALRLDSERRQAEQARLLGEALRLNKNDRPAIERLKRSAVSPPAAGGCGISEALRDVEDRL